VGIATSVLSLPASTVQQGQGTCPGLSATGWVAASSCDGCWSITMLGCCASAPRTARAGLTLAVKLLWQFEVLLL